MRNRILITLLVISIISFIPSSNYAQWARTYGGIGVENAMSIQQTSDGGFIVVGDAGSFGVEGLDFWILKLDSTGVIEWQKIFGGSGNDYAHSIQQTIDGGYIVGGETYSFGVEGLDFWILKLDPAGAIDWQQTYGGSGNDWFRSLQQTNDGGYIVAGFTDSFGAGANDFWVLKLDPAGAIDWQRTYGGSGWDYAHSIQQTIDGGYIVAGETSSFGVEIRDFWILKLDQNGDIEWQQTYGGNSRDFARSIQQTIHLGYIVAGITTSSSSAGQEDFLILKLTSNGNIDPSCGEFVKRSDCITYDSEIIPLDTTAKTKKTKISSQDTSVIPQNSEALTTLTCMGDKPPRKPKRLKAKAMSREKIKLRWKDKAKNEDGFMIERRKTTSGPWEVIKEIKPNTKKYIDKGLEANTTYHYRARAFNSSGYSAYSNIAKATTKK